MGSRDTCSLWFKEMKLGHVDESYRETYFGLFKEGFSILRAFKVELVAYQQSSEKGQVLGEN